MLHKSFPASVKLADDTADQGIFEALVSVFGNVDSYGDRVMPGAFTRTLDEWDAKGLPIPVYYSHRLDDPDMNLGHVLEAKETEDGLWVRAQLDLEAPKAVTTLRLMKGGRLSQFSFSYAIAPNGMKEAEDGAMELSDLDLYEVGPTPVGANPQTELLGVKSGRVLSAKNLDLIVSARDALSDLISAASPAVEDDDEKASHASRAKVETSRARKTEEPHAQWSVEAWSLPFLAEIN